MTDMNLADAVTLLVQAGKSIQQQVPKELLREALPLLVQDINRRIDLLMDDNRRMRDERDHAVAALSEQIATLIRERDEAIKERDRARRTICRMESVKRYDQARRDLPGKKIIAVKPEMVAQECGWFCFCKEEP